MSFILPQADLMDKKSLSQSKSVGFEVYMYRLDYTLNHLHSLWTFPHICGKRMGVHTRPLNECDYYKESR